MDEQAHIFILITILRPADEQPSEDDSFVHREFPIGGGQVYSELYCGALNHVNNFFRPDYSLETVSSAKCVVQETVQSYLVRTGKFDGEQQDELAFQAELLKGLEPVLPKHWRENIAHPYLAFYQDLKVLDDYEYTLIYLLIEALHKNSNGNNTALQRELENLRISWSCTMGPGEGYISSLLIFMAADGARWWGQRPQFNSAIREPVILDLLAALRGIGTAFSGQLIAVGRKPDLGKAAIAGLINACSSSIFLLPAINRWMDRLTQQEK